MENERFTTIKEKNEQMKVKECVWIVQRSAKTTIYVCLCSNQNLFLSIIAPDPLHFRWPNEENAIRNDSINKFKWTKDIAGFRLPFFMWIAMHTNGGGWYQPMIVIAQKGKITAVHA